MIDISSLKATAEALKQQYIAEAKAQKPHRIFQDYNTEQEQMKQYCGREILELLQNADDARSSHVELHLNSSTHELTITNSGPDTILFTEEGFNSLMYAHLSPKRRSSIPMIGNKGLGFRSILNWASKISIDSDNTHVEFAPEIAIDFWEKNLAGLIDKSNNEVPLAILALPLISELSSSVNCTSIKLKFKESFLTKIADELRNFRPQSLLFLHHLNTITINIDGEVLSHQNVIIANHNRVRESLLNNERWICVYEEGELHPDGESAQAYEAAAAFCLDSSERLSEPVYCFFPTRVNFGLPCILHATLELDSSRNSINEGSPLNASMMENLSHVIIRLADELKSRQCTWNPYMLLNPTSPGKASAYELKLYNYLQNHPGEYIPTLSGCYLAPNECYYFNDEIADIIIEHQQQSLFSNMRQKKVGNLFFTDLPRDLDAVIKSLETLANEIDDYDDLAQLIIAISQYANRREFDLHIFRNSDNKTITGRTYINEGKKISSLPDFLDFDYINPNLQESLQERLALTGNHKERMMADILSHVGPISSSDKSSVISNILPTEKDLKRSEQERRELLICLFKLYLGPDGIEKIASKEKPFLPAADGSWRPAHELVLNDRRFPDGYLNLGIKSIYKPEQCVAYPEFLESVEGSTPESIQDFLLKFSVQKYILTHDWYYGDEIDYLEYLNLTPEIKNNCRSWKDHERRNTTRIATEGTIDTLHLNDLITLLRRYPEYISEHQKIHWYLNTYKTPVEVSLNYAAFELQQLPAVAQLKFYAVYDREWLPGKEPAGVRFANNAETDNLLLKLGAARTWDDFPAETLYEAINSRTEQWVATHNDSGIKSFYHKVKQALASKNATPPDNLTLLCRTAGELTIRKASEVFYSDNIGVKELRNKLPMLELQLRDGEEQVKSCFGCRLIKDLKAIIDAESLSLNSRLESEIADKLERLKPYILALAARNAGSRGGDNAKQYAEVKSAINSISIRVVADATYHYEGADQHLNAILAMAEGDLIDFGGVITLCSRHYSLNGALLDPQFVNAIAEVICINLKLNSAENIDRFYRLLKADARELDFMVKNDIDAPFWDECREAFGVSDAEADFWLNVFHANGMDDEFDVEALKKDKVNFLMIKLKIDRQLASMQNFIEMHTGKLKDEYLKYVGPYLRHIHSDLLQKTDEEQARYYRLQEDFKLTDWCDSAAKEIQFQLNPDYPAIVAQYVRDKYGFTLPENADSITAPQEHKEYLQGHDEYGLYLNDKERSWLYFDGKEEYFKALISRQLHNNEDAETADEQSPISQIAKISEVTSSPLMPTTSNKKGGGVGGGSSHFQAKPSERMKKLLGNRAEDGVYESLMADDDYEVGAVYSKHLCEKYKLATSDDGKGYDLEYRRKGDALWRCLEIKHSNGHSIIMSDNEFQKATKHNRYDIALYVNGEVRIWRNALSDSNNFIDKLGDHTITFRLQEAGEEDGGDAGGGHPA